MEIKSYFWVNKNELRPWELNFIGKDEYQNNYKYENIFVVDWELYENLGSIYFFWDKNSDNLIFWKFNNSKYYVLFEWKNLIQVQEKIKLNYWDSLWKIYTVVWEINIWEKVFVVFYGNFYSQNYWNYPYFFIEKSKFLENFEKIN